MEIYKEDLTDLLKEIISQPNHCVRITNHINIVFFSLNFFIDQHLKRKMPQKWEKKRNFKFSITENDELKNGIE